MQEVLQKSQASKYDSYVKELRNQLKEADNKIASLKTEVSHSKLPEIPRSDPNEAAMRELREALRRAERAERAARAELEQRSAQDHNTELLKQKLSDMESKCERLQKAAAEAAAERTHVEAMANLLDRWHTFHAMIVGTTDAHQDVKAFSRWWERVSVSGTEGFAAAISEGSRAVEEVTSALQTLQADSAILLDNLGTCQAKLNACMIAKRRAESRTAELEAARFEIDRACAEAKAEAFRQSRFAATLEQELSSMRALISSYEAEAAAFNMQISSSTSSVPATQAKILALEGALAEANARIEKANAAMATLCTKAQLEVERRRAEALEAQLAAAKEELEVLYDYQQHRSMLDPSKEAQSTGIDTAAAARIAASGGDPSTAIVGSRVNKLRILHMAINPTSAALTERDFKLKAALNALNSENKALAQQVHQLNTAAMPKGEDAVATPPVVNLDVSTLGSASIEASLSSAANVELEKLRTRMKEVFKQRLALVREAVYRLLGYKVDVSMNQSGPVDVILRSMYFDQEAVSCRPNSWGVMYTCNNAALHCRIISSSSLAMMRPWNCWRLSLRDGWIPKCSNTCACTSPFRHFLLSSRWIPSASKP